MASGRVALGDVVRHRINGFQGAITGTTEYINGCRQHLVHPQKLTADGGLIEGAWVDEQHLELVERGLLPNPFATGGPVLAGGPDRHERATR